MDSLEQIKRSTRHFFSGTLISRFFGLGREIVMAALFGSNPSVAAFWMAYRFSNVLRRLLGEGALQAAFIPLFEEKKAQNSQTGAIFCQRVHATMVFILLGVLLLGFLLLATLDHGISFNSGTKEVVHLTMIMLPSIFFICLGSLYQAVHQSLGKFFLAAVSPVGFNIVWIGGAFLIGGDSVFQSLEKLSFIIVIAYIVQWAILLPKVIDLCRLDGISLWGLKGAFNQDSRLLIRRLSYAALGVGAVQLNSAVDMIFARCADLAAPAYLNYAIRIYQAPLALLGIGLSQAMLPLLTRLRQGDQENLFFDTLKYGLTQTLGIMVPCTLGIWLVGVESINLVFGRGAFDAEAVRQTGLCLWAYIVGLIPSTWVNVLASGYYSKQNLKYPSLVSLFMVLVNMLLNAFLIFVVGLGGVSVALATSFCAYLNVVCLLRPFKKEGMHSCFSVEKVLRICSVSVGAFLLGSLSLYFVSGHWPAIFSATQGSVILPRELKKQLLEVMVPGIVFLATLWTSWKFKLCPELGALFEFFYKARKKIVNK